MSLQRHFSALEMSLPHFLGFGSIGIQFLAWTQPKAKAHHREH